MSGISILVARLVERYPAMRSIWMIDDRAGSDPDCRGAWDLVAFADTSTLHSLRKAIDLHRVDVVLRIVTDGDRFEAAWGQPNISGSLFQWEWRQTSDHEAYYSETRWKEPVASGNVERTRRKASLLWQPAPVRARGYAPARYSPA